MIFLLHVPPVATRLVVGRDLAIIIDSIFYIIFVGLLHIMLRNDVAVVVLFYDVEQQIGRNAVVKWLGLNTDATL